MQKQQQKTNEREQVMEVEIREGARFTPKERNEYVASRKEYWDNYSIVDTAHKKGLAEGEAKGLAKGRAEERAKAKQEKLETARKLKAMNLLTINQIADATGLTAEELEAL